LEIRKQSADYSWDSSFDESLMEKSPEDILLYICHKSASSKLNFNCIRFLLLAQWNKGVIELGLCNFILIQLRMSCLHVNFIC